MTDRFWAKVDKRGPVIRPDLGRCWLWTSAKNAAGYGRFKFQSKQDYAHRVAYTLTYGLIDDGLFICHRCDNPSCVNPTHLFAAPAKENSLDRDLKGRGILPGAGIQHPSALFSESDIREIRRRRKEGETCISIANSYGVARTTISGICTRQKWAHV